MLFVTIVVIHIYSDCAVLAAQERCPLGPYADEQLLPQRVYKLKKPHGCRRGRRDSGRVLAGRANSRGRRSLPHVFVSRSVALG